MVSIDRRTWHQTSTSSASFELITPSVRAVAATEVRYVFDEAETALDITLEVRDGDQTVAKRTWRQVRPR